MKIPVVSIFGKDSKIGSLESITNSDVAKIVLPGQNRDVDALRIVHDNQSKGRSSIIFCTSKGARAQDQQGQHCCHL